MLPNVAISARLPGQPSPYTRSQMDSLNVALGASEQEAEQRRASLAAEARRLARRRSVAEAVAARSRQNDRNLPGDAPTHLFQRAKSKSTRLSLVFHRAIESLWEAGGFDEALAIFRESKGDAGARSRTIPIGPMRSN
ncbi:hypothetical protein TA3x_000101 [Tundrisphaera sp. TA3]|uniref:hypothetical protein n=1 Tax=Tundrisphaera sp. TA3 TaxID=3435775 RepID=UPI003EB7534A